MNRKIYHCISCDNKVLEPLFSLWNTLLVDKKLYEIESVYNICSKCGVISTYPPVPINLLQAHYNSMENIEAIFFKNRSDAAFKFISSYFNKKLPLRVLDIGCGEGYLLSLFKSKGSSVAGVDPSKNRSAAATKRYGIKEFYASLQELKDMGGSFDLIILSHVLEHLNNPKDFIKNLAKLVKKTGFIYIEVPAVNRAADARENFVHLTHIHHFTTATLIEFCRQLKLETVSSQDDIICNYPCARILVKPTAKTNRCHQSKNISKQEINKAKENFLSVAKERYNKYLNAAKSIRQLERKGEIVIWGGGSDTLQLLHEYPDLKSIVSRIIDSDPNKLGLKLCGIEIENQENLLHITQPVVILLSVLSAQTRMEIEKKINHLSIRNKKIIHLFK